MTGLPLEELPRFLTWKDNIIRPDTMDMEEAAAIRKQTGAEIYEFFERAIDDAPTGKWTTSSVASCEPRSTAAR